MSVALNIEWRHRIEQWRKALRRLIYRPLGAIDLSGFTTIEQLSPEAAKEGPFQPMPPGTKWGAKWEYAWMKGTVSLPEEAVGRRIDVRLRPGGEMLVFLNDRAIGGGDLTLTLSGRAGEVFKILVETYAGHGPAVVTAGPVPPGKETVPEPPPTQQTVGESTFGITEEDVFQLWMDVETLWNLRESLDEDMLRVSEIDEGLRDVTRIVDPELPEDEMLESVRAGRERLRPLLECRNGSTSPLMYAFGHGHLDVGWLWPLAHTDRKAARTLAGQLALARQYPGYKFIHSQPELFQRVKERYPELYGRVKEAIANGSVIAEGSTWVEMDTNVTGGESLIRQFLYGKQFYREEFGVETELMWLPDVFGYSGAMPQIMRGSEVKYFATAKIFWTYNGGDPFPRNTFYWEGIDGSRVIVHLCDEYGSQMRPSDVIERWRQLRRKEGINSRLMPFGWGDGGGGPTAIHLEFARREQDLEGCPRVKIASPVDYFHDLEAGGAPDARYVGELYFQAHRGTYTSQAWTKRLNRKSEVALREAEMWATLAGGREGFEFSPRRFDEAWRRVMTNQFHDILPGSSIARVYADAEAHFKFAIREADQVAEAARKALADADGEALTLFNSLSWERSALVQLPDGWQGARAADGAPLPVQQMEGELVSEVSVPSCGWTTIRRGERAEVRSELSASEHELENALLRVQFDAKGQITSIFDKESDRELAAGPCNAIRMYKDVPTAWDAWDIDSMYEDTPVELDEDASIGVVCEGPLTAALRIRRRIHNSDLLQEVSLARGRRRVDFRTTINWQERHKLLKVNFPVTFYATEAIHEIQFGHIRRPNHASRPFDEDRFEVSNQKWTALAEGMRGFAVLNDCKYGVNVAQNSINLTLLKSPLAPDMRADQGRQEFTYAFYAWNGPFCESNLIREGYELNYPVTSAAGAGGEASVLAVDAPNVIIEAVKAAEDGSGDVIVRLYEAMCTATRCKLVTSLPLKGAVETNMLERAREELQVEDDGVVLQLRPFEIKTVRIKL